MGHDRSRSLSRDYRRARSRSRSAERYGIRSKDEYYKNRGRESEHRRDEEYPRDNGYRRDDYRRDSRRPTDNGARRYGEGRRGTSSAYDRARPDERHEGPRNQASMSPRRDGEVEIGSPLRDQRDSQGQVSAPRHDAKRPEPLSLKELLKRKEAEKAAEARPVFLSKKEREQAALARRAEEAADARARLATVREGLGAGISERGTEAGADSQGRGPEQDRVRERELESIKRHYLGLPPERKKAVKAADRFKFVFDWDASEDTSRDLNPLYQNLHEASLLFGRGFRAGIDRREQRKTAAGQEAELLRAMRDRAGERVSAEDERRDARRLLAADRYEGRDMAESEHWTSKTREEMTERDWRIFREDYNISYKGSNVPMPLRGWSEADFPEVVSRGIERAGYAKPSPIQMAAIPLGLQQRDVIGVAETGSGKTAAFVLPMLVYILGQPPMRGNPEVEAEGPYAVVLAPTRELAQQIEEETRNLAHYTDFRVVSVVGGQSIEEQGFALRKGCEIVVATPGRLVDCLARSYAVLNQCNYVVLDEADRMIDMGFEPQVVAVLDAMPSSNLKPEALADGTEPPLEADRVYRTTYMFSATMPPAVERLARTYLRRPTVINIGKTGKAADTVTQRVLMLKDNEKPAALEQELEAVGEDRRVIVFVNTKRQCDTVARQLGALGYRCTLLHGGKTQDQREESIRGFREDVYNVLVATDVAGRGIDVPDVALVVNYDMPNNIEAYTHRIGRTGRAGRKGIAVTFLTLHDQEVFYDFKKFLEDSNAGVPSQLAQHQAARQKPGTQRRDTIQYAKK